MLAYTDHIYTLVDPRTNQVRYVGKTNNPDMRMSYHLKLREGNEGKNTWIRELLELGLTPVMNVIETVHYTIPRDLTVESSAQRERYWIRYYLAQKAQLFNIDVEGGHAMSTQIRKMEMATKTDLRQYWLASPERQIRTLEVIRQEDLEAVARERKLVIYGGKLVSPKDYPCTCIACDPVECHEEKRIDYGSMPNLYYHPNDRVCPCPCHTYYDGRSI